MTVETLPASNGDTTLRVTAGGRSTLIHSARNPSAEAEAWAAAQPCDGDAFVLFGLGLGYHALRLLPLLPAAARVFVVEPLLAVEECRSLAPRALDALSARGAAFGRDWPALRDWLSEAGVAWDGVRLLSIPSYQRLFGADHGTIALHLRARAGAPEALALCPELFSHSPGVSVVVSTYNRPAEAARLVAVLQRQRAVRGGYEILVVNDNGSADVFDAVRGAGAGPAPVRAFDTRYPGYGLALARNVGIRFARYDTVICLDDDLLVDEGLVAAYQSAPEGLRLGRVECPIELNGGTRLIDPRGAIMQGRARPIDDLDRYRGFLYGGNFAVPTDLALAVGGFDEAYLDEGEEDMDLGARIIAAAQAAVTVPEARAVHPEPTRTLANDLGLASAPRRVGRADERLRQPGRGPIVNGGLRYWLGPRWDAYRVTENRTISTTKATKTQRHEDGRD